MRVCVKRAHPISFCRGKAKVSLSLWNHKPGHSIVLWFLLLCQSPSSCLSMPLPLSLFYCQGLYFWVKAWIPPRVWQSFPHSTSAPIWNPQRYDTSSTGNQSIKDNFSSVCRYAQYPYQVTFDFVFIWQINCMTQKAPKPQKQSFAVESYCTSEWLLIGDAHWTH